MIEQIKKCYLEHDKSKTLHHAQAVAETAVSIADVYGLDTHKVTLAALLHDVGKIGIPDAILKKQGRLTPEEYKIIKDHTKRDYIGW